MNERLTEQKSIYLQISEMIETDILRGILMEEEQVPSTNELARLYIINPATAAKGVNLLVDNGILYKKRGIGMFVAKGASRNLIITIQIFLSQHWFPQGFPLLSVCSR